MEARRQLPPEATRRKPATRLGRNVPPRAVANKDAQSDEENGNPDEEPVGDGVIDDEALANMAIPDSACELRSDHRPTEHRRQRRHPRRSIEGDRESNSTSQECQQRKPQVVDEGPGQVRLGGDKVAEQRGYSH